MFVICSNREVFLERSFFTLLFYFISLLMHFHRFCDQNKTQLNRMSSDPSNSELVVRTMLISPTKINSCTIVHYFHCISKGSTIVYLIGGDGVGNFFLQEFVSAAKIFV